MELHAHLLRLLSSYLQVTLQTTLFTFFHNVHCVDGPVSNEDSLRFARILSHGSWSTRQTVVHKPIVKLSICVEPALVSNPHDGVTVVGHAVVYQVPQKLRYEARRKPRQRFHRHERQRVQLLAYPQDGVALCIRPVRPDEHYRADVVCGPAVGLKEGPADVRLQSCRSVPA